MNVSVCVCVSVSLTTVSMFLVSELFISNSDRIPFCFAGLEDSTTGSVAEAIGSVLRGCLEHMPTGT